MIAESIRLAVLEHAARDYPRESCGLLVRPRFAREVSGVSRSAPESTSEPGLTGVVYVPCRNLADGQAHFVLSPDDYAAAEASGEVVAVVHSHPNARPEPSAPDRESMRKHGLPWLIASWPLGEVKLHYPDPGHREPLVGRVFSHGVLDCFSLIRDYYAWELGVELPDFDRPDSWWSKGGNLYLDNYSRAGFRDVTGQALQPGDVVLMRLHSRVPNHGAVFVGNGVILHHLAKRLSRRETYAGFWRQITSNVLRHASR